MKTLKLIWRELSVFLGFFVPREVDENLPTTLDEYRERRRINDELAQIARRRMRGEL